MSGIRRAFGVSADPAGPTVVSVGFLYMSRGTQRTEIFGTLLRTPIGEVSTFLTLSQSNLGETSHIG
jgi:hypothetical protein